MATLIELAHAGIHDDQLGIGLAYYRITRASLFTHSIITVTNTLKRVLTFQDGNLGSQ